MLMSSKHFFTITNSGVIPKYSIPWEMTESMRQILMSLEKQVVFSTKNLVKSSKNDSIVKHMNNSFYTSVNNPLLTELFLEQ